MRSILLILLVWLLTSCISATREREVHCLAATMMDTWQMEHELDFAEQAWRAAQQARFERSSGRRDSLTPSLWLATHDASSVARGGEAAGLPSSDGDEEQTLYQRATAARARYGDTMRWYRLVAQRVQNRIEEDEMLNPVLGMLVTSPAIVFYPLLRWNVRSVVWDGTDPDADNDPVRVFCIARLSEDYPIPRP